MSESTWSEPTRTWVERGWVDASQRASLQAWLDENRPPPGPSPFLDVALTAVVTLGNWLLVGGLLLACGLFLPPAAYNLGVQPLAAAALVAAFCQLGAGVLARVAGARSLAHGFLSAWVLVSALATIAVLEGPWDGIRVVNLVVVLVPCLLAVAFALADRLSGLAASASLAICIALMLHLFAFKAPAHDIAFIACGLLVVVLSVGARLLPDREPALAATMPFITTFALTAVFWHHTLIDKSLLREAYLWEIGGLSTAFGITLLASGMLSRSRLTLLSGVAAMIFSEVVLLMAVGDMLFGIVALLTEGALLVGGAMGVLAVRGIWFRPEPGEEAVAAPEPVVEAAREPVAVLPEAGEEVVL